MDPNYLSQFINENSNYIGLGIIALSALYGYLLLKSSDKFLEKAEKKQRLLKQEIIENALESAVKKINIDPMDNKLSHINNYGIIELH